MHSPLSLRYSARLPGVGGFIAARGLFHALHSSTQADEQRKERSCTAEYASGILYAKEGSLKREIACFRFKSSSLRWPYRQKFKRDLTNSGLIS
jgi:hypothetical protein